MICLSNCAKDSRMLRVISPSFGGQSRLQRNAERNRDLLRRSGKRRLSRSPIYIDRERGDKYFVEPGCWGGVDRVQCGHSFLNGHRLLLDEPLPTPRSAASTRWRVRRTSGSLGDGGIPDAPGGSSACPDGCWRNQFLHFPSDESSSELADRGIPPAPQAPQSGDPMYQPDGVHATWKQTRQYSSRLSRRSFEDRTRVLHLLPELLRVLDAAKGDGSKRAVMLFGQESSPTRCPTGSRSARAPV